MIRPDGTQPDPVGFTTAPWINSLGLNIDGNDDVWVGNLAPRNAPLL